MAERVEAISRERWLRRLYLPAYAVGEAARLARVHRTTVSSWYYGRRTQPGMRAAKVLGQRPRGAPLSYLDLVEVAFVATLRGMRVPLRRIRVAWRYLAKRFETDFPFAQLDLKTDGASVLYALTDEEGAWLEKLLVDAGESGQIMWAEPVWDRIREFDYDERHSLAIRWFPRGRDGPIIVDPRIQFGAPILRDSGLATWAVRERFQAGESVQEITEDFGIQESAVWHALEFEEVGAAAPA